MITLTRLLSEVAPRPLTRLSWCLKLVADLWHGALSQDFCMQRTNMQHGSQTCCCMLCL